MPRFRNGFASPTTTFVLATALCMAAAPAVPAPPDPGWTATGSLAAARNRHTATLLPTGRILVAGGSSGGTPYSTCELFDPATGSWSATGSFATGPRHGHAAQILAGGRVLVAGSHDNRSAVDLYDPAAGTWSVTGAMSAGRDGLTLSLLPGGKVLAAGGHDGSGGSRSSCEIYDPATGGWTATGSMGEGHRGHSTVLLADGRVLVTGGHGASVLATCEVYDPASGSWSSAGSLPFGARFLHTATLLPGGKVLVAGGNNNGSRSECALFDPATAAWTTTGSLATARDAHTATLLRTGKVLVTGGALSRPGYDSIPLSSCELYDPASGTWSPAPSLTTGGRWQHPAVTMADGRVLVAGGYQYGPSTSASEIYEPGPAVCSGSWSSRPPMATTRVSSAAAVHGGRLYVAGGYYSPGASRDLEAYDPATNSWTTKASMPTGRDTLALVEAGGSLYAIGGLVNSGDQQLAVVEAYDPSTDSWTTKAPLNTARFGHAAAAMGGKIYVCGGWGFGPAAVLGSLEIYDPASNSWSYGPPMPTPRLYAGAAVVNGILHVVGGTTTGPALGTVETFDPATQAWSTRAPMPTARTGPVLGVIGGEIYAAGGAAPGLMFAALEAYNPLSNSWRTATPLPVARGAAAGTALGGILYVAGGNRGGVLTAAVEAFDPSCVHLVVPSPVTAECQGSGGATVTFQVEVTGTPPYGSTLVVRDATHGATLLSASAAAGSFNVSGLFAKGTSTVEATVADAVREYAKASFTVNVVDTTPPVLGGIGPKTVECQGASTPISPASLGITATDACDPGPALTLSHTSLPLGTTSVAATASDHETPANVSSAVLSVTVVDTTPPSVSCPSSLTLTTDCSGSPLAITPQMLGATAADVCDPAPVLSCSPTSLAPGTTTVTCTATDHSGNTAACTTSVTVLRGPFATLFLQPLDGSKDNLVKAGQTVPVKIQVACGAAFEAGAAVTLHAVDQIDASGSSVANTVPEDAGLANDGGNAFRLADGHYVFNLSTKGWSAASGARFRVTIRAAKAGHVDTFASVILQNR